MNYIKNRADQFAKRHFAKIPDQKTIINDTKEEINNIDSEIDKITFLTVVLEQNATSSEKHKATCKTVGCRVEFAHDTIGYYLTQEINRLGIKTNNDQFTVEEKVAAEIKLDQILLELQTIKDGQQIIYDELDSLKELFILGKKTWKQLFLGKTTEMVMSGVISETMSKKIIATVGEIDFINLLDFTNG